MKTRFLTLLLALCLLLPLTVIAADSPVLPDLVSYANDLLTPGTAEDFGFCQRTTLYGTKENVKLAAESYIDLLLNKYSICKHAHFTTFYDGGQTRRHYALGYTGAAQVGTVGYDDENEGWQISDAAVILVYSQYDGDNYIQLTYRSEFSCVDTGDRLQASIPLSLPAAPDPQPGTEAASSDARSNVTEPAEVLPCTACNGTGRHQTSCTSCGGDGKTSRNCSSCGGDGKRTCSSCSGTGHHSDSHHSSSHHNSSKCSSCGGDGKRTCSSCSGRGHTASACSSCSGKGQRSIACSSCGGSGKIN